uniref:Retrovirus-related Pol polyprotein from transposon TNT 1-94 n=1 Tax=Tanacetum cinerariifolium TaxID=118510 RepID=A0A699HBD6_TANCI|nr:retrovirus-related Pol polyprotein from transposon TNT 1-94 [Tanacetum cinerariifolium]
MSHHPIKNYRIASMSSPFAGVRPSSPIIEDWVSDSEDESETKPQQNIPSFVQSTEQVKSPRPFVQHVKTSIPAATPKPASPKPTSNGKKRNRKACFVCKILTQSKPVSITAVRPPINHSQSPKASNSPHRATAVQALVVSTARDNPQHALKDKGVIDSGCSRHMTRNMSYLYDLKELNSRYVSFGGNPKGGKIYRKGKIKTGKLDINDVYFVKELKCNIFSVSQMCDKKNSVLFTDTECLVLSPEFKLPDESQVLLRVPKENNMYNDNLKNIVPSGDLTCLFAKATIDESNLWHRRLGHIIFKTMNKLVKGNLVRGLPTKVFENDNTCVACKKEKQHRASLTKPHNKTPYELLHGITPSIGFMRPFGRPVTILNTLDSLGKFDGNVDEGFLVRYSISSKAFRVFNSRTCIVQETLHVNFLENKPNVVGSGPTWLFDIDSFTKTMNYQPVTVGNQSNRSAGFQDKFDVEKAGEESDQHKRNKMTRQKREAKGKSPVESFTRYRDLSAEFEDYSEDNINEVNPAELEDITYSDDEDDVGAEADFNNLETSITVSPIPTTRVHKDHLEELLQFKMQNVWVLVDLPYGKRAIGTKWVFKNKKDERGIVVRNKARLITQGHTQEEGINYKEVFAPLARIEAIRLFLAYPSFMGFMVYQMDVKSAFLYGTIEEEVYVCQPLGFEDLDNPDKVYKVVKTLYGLHQAPRAWYETLANYLLKNGFQRGKIDQILFIKRQKGDILLVQIYVDDIIFGATNKDLCKSFEKLMKDKFQMSLMGELTFFLGLQVKQKKDEIFISQDKYIAEILRKFGLKNTKSASTPIDIEKPLLKDPDGEDVDMYTYRSMIGSLMYLTSSRPDIMFTVCACARFQVTPKASHLHAVKRIFRYLKGKPHLGLWYPKDSPFDLVAYSDSDYANASLDRKSTTGGCQFLGCRLIS